jgi:hypothetical protein
MRDLPLIPLSRPFGGDQLIVALNAGHAKFGTTIGQYRRHGSLPRSPSLRREVVVKIIAIPLGEQRFASILINGESLVPCNIPTEYKEALYSFRYGRQGPQNRARYRGLCCCQWSHWQNRTRKSEKHSATSFQARASSPERGATQNLIWRC